MLWPDDIIKRAITLIFHCRDRGLLLATAESCTGGLVAACLTEVAGSSAVVDRGFVTYSNAAKMELLGVRQATIEAHGAVSRETAIEMAKGAIAQSLADIAVSLTGIAGPTGATPGKPVGLVHLAVARRGGEVVSHAEVFVGNRTEVRVAALRQAITMIEEAAR